MSRSLPLAHSGEGLLAARPRRPDHGLRSRIAVLTVALVWWSFAAQTQALTAAGAFGRGANQQMVRAVRAITEVLTNNLLGFVGATILLVIVGLAAGHIYGDERAHEKTLKVVKGVFMLVAAGGLVG